MKNHTVLRIAILAAMLLSGSIAPATAAGIDAANRASRLDADGLHRRRQQPG